MLWFLPTLIVLAVLLPIAAAARAAATRTVAVRVRDDQATRRPR